MRTIRHDLSIHGQYEDDSHSSKRSRLLPSRSQTASSGPRNAKSTKSADTQRSESARRCRPRPPLLSPIRPMLNKRYLGGSSANAAMCPGLPPAIRHNLRRRDCQIGEPKIPLARQDLSRYDLVPERIDAGVCIQKSGGWGGKKKGSLKKRLTNKSPTCPKHLQTPSTTPSRRPIPLLAPRRQNRKELTYPRLPPPGLNRLRPQKNALPATSSSQTRRACWPM